MFVILSLFKFLKDQLFSLVAYCEVDLWFGLRGDHGALSFIAGALRLRNN